MSHFNACIQGLRNGIAQSVRSESGYVNSCDIYIRTIDQYEAVGRNTVTTPANVEILVDVEMTAANGDTVKLSLTQVGECAQQVADIVALRAVAALRV